MLKDNQHCYLNKIEFDNACKTSIYVTCIFSENIDRLDSDWLTNPKLSNDIVYVENIVNMLK